MIKTMTMQECMEHLRAHGLSISQDTLANGIEQGVYPFGLCVIGGKRRVFQIFKKKLDAWISEVEVDE